jgi:hypothetical protein
MEVAPLYPGTREMALPLLTQICIALRPLFTGSPIMSNVFDSPRGAVEPNTPLSEGDVVELPLLLPEWQVTKLETVAYARGMTAAAMVRYLLRDFLTVAPLQQSTSSSPLCGKLP